MIFTVSDASNRLLEEARSAYRNLDIVKAYQKVLQAAEEDPKNYGAYYLLDDLIQVISFSYSDIYDKDRIQAAVDRTLQLSNNIPICWSLKGILHKIDYDYENAEEAYFQACYTSNNNDMTSWLNSYHQLFKLAYTYKNVEDFETFNQIVFSMEWNVQLYRKIKKTAFPFRVIKKRLVEIDFNLPPVKYIRELKKNPQRLYFLTTKEKISDWAGAVNYLGAFDKQGVRFRFYYLPPRMIQRGVVFSGSLPPYFPQSFMDCDASIQVDNYKITLCPPLYERTAAIFNKLPPLWKASIEKQPWCECRP